MLVWHEPRVGQTKSNRPQDPTMVARAMKRKYESSSSSAKESANARRARKVSRLLRAPEIGYQEVAIGQSIANAMTAPASINSIVQGDDYRNRQGNVVRQLYLQYSGQVAFNTNVGSAPIRWRFILFLDRQPNGASPSVTDVLDTSIISSSYAYKNKRLNDRRFKILREHTGYVASSGSHQEDGMFSGFIDFTKMDPTDQIVQYNGPSGGPVTNGVYWMAVAETAGSTVILNAGLRWAFCEK